MSRGGILDGFDPKTALIDTPSPLSEISHEIFEAVKYSLHVKRTAQDAKITYND